LFRSQNSKSRTQDITNKAAIWLFYIALASGFITLFIWLALGYSFDVALERMVTVMVIICPHALGLAAPLVVAVSTSLAAKHGLLIRNRTNFEGARQLDAILFDKTGTLTEGSFGVTDIIPTNNYDEETVLRFAASLEQHSEHPIATGIVSSAKEKGISLQEISEFKSMTGKSIQGQISSKFIAADTSVCDHENYLPYSEALFSDLSASGKTVVFLLIDDELAGMIALAYIVRETAKEAILLLEKEGIRSIMLTGDNEKVAYWVAGQVGIEDVYAEVLPDEQAIHAKQIMEEKGWKVAMTGDGINDAPALATANLGIAIGAGTDVAMETADVVLVKSNPKDVVSLID